MKQLEGAACRKREIHIKKMSNVLDDGRGPSDDTFYVVYCTSTYLAYVLVYNVGN